MFFGKVLTPATPFTFSPSTVEEKSGEVLSLSNVVLAPSSKEGGSLWIQKDGEEFLIAQLTKQQPNANINIFISLLDDVTLTVKGNGATLHVVGFFEPDHDAELPFGEGSDEEGEEEEEEAEEVEQNEAPAAKTNQKQSQPAPAQKPSSPKQAPQNQKPAQPQQKKPAAVEESDEEDEDFDGQEHDDEEELEDDEQIDDDLDDEDADED